LRNRFANPVVASVSDTEYRVELRRNENNPLSQAAWEAAALKSLGEAAAQSGGRVVRYGMRGMKMVATVESSPIGYADRFLALESFCQERFKTYQIDGDENEGSLTIYMGSHVEVPFNKWHLMVLKALQPAEKMLGIKITPVATRMTRNFGTSTQTVTEKTPRVIVNYVKRGGPHDV
jgi:hypothetical protein